MFVRFRAATYRLQASLTRRVGSQIMKVEIGPAIGRCQGCIRIVSQ